MRSATTSLSTPTWCAKAKKTNHKSETVEACDYGLLEKLVESLRRALRRQFCDSDLSGSASLRANMSPWRCRATAATRISLATVATAFLRWKRSCARYFRRFPPQRIWLSRRYGTRSSTGRREYFAARRRSRLWPAVQQMPICTAFRSSPKKGETGCFRDLQTRSAGLPFSEVFDRYHRRRRTSRSDANGAIS